MIAPPSETALAGPAPKRGSAGKSDRTQYPRADTELTDVAPGHTSSGSVCLDRGFPTGDQVVDNHDGRYHQ